MNNRSNFLFERDAYLTIKLLVPRYATAASVKKDGNGYWINVAWKCGIIAPLTVQEELQASDQEKENAEGPRIP